MTMYHNTGKKGNSSENDFFFPIARSIQPTLLGGGDPEKIQEIKDRVKMENREGQINSIINGEEYEYKSYENDREYKKLIGSIVPVKPMNRPTGIIFYTDFTYGSTNSR